MKKTKNKDKQFVDYIMNTQTGNWDLYYKELGIYNKNLRIKERTGWRNQCSAINKVHDASKLFKILSKDPTQIAGSLLLPNGEYTKNQQETYKHLLDFHFPNCRLTNIEEHNRGTFSFEREVN